MISLKNQVIFFLLCFALIISTQILFANINQNSLIDSFSDYHRASTEERLVKRLERDVLDLQRFVLIYNETGNSSLIERFTVLHKEIFNALETINKNLPSDLKTAQSADTIQAMQLHISDYKENFESAQAARFERDKLLNERVLSGINELIAEAPLRFPSAQLSTNRHEAQYRNQLILLKNIVFQYVLNPSSLHQKDFFSVLSEASKLTQFMLNDQQSVAQLKIEDIKEQFVNLTQVTQSYLFLVKVVMAGSANEFLYLADELSVATRNYSEQMNEVIAYTIADSKMKLNLSSTLGILLTILIGLFIVLRIIRPVKHITNAFDALIDDKEVEKIPGIDRKDEIGKLAQAAKIFKAKSNQTRYLLKNAQEQNERQISLNNQLEQAIVRADNANKSKSIFLANMSHEIRTPMNGIIGLVDLSLQQELSTKVRQNLDKVAYSSQILMNVINDILDFSKIEAGKLQIENSFFSFAALFDSLLAVSSVKAAEKNLNLQLYVDPDLPRNALGDQLRISQVILNLCTNAIKFTQTGTINISVTHESVIDAPSKFKLKVSVKDSGIGIEEQQLKTIFSPFVQADSQNNRQFGGSGLGLAIVKQLTELMKGDVSVVSKVGEGSEFISTFLLSHENSPHPLINDINQYQSNIIYVSDYEDPLIASNYIERISSHVERLTHREFIDSYTNLNPEDIVIFDIEHGRQARTIYPVITELHNLGFMFGGVTNTQPDQLGKVVSEQWRCPVLAHPFSPTEFYLFSNALYKQDSLFSHKQESNLLGDSITPVNNVQYHGHVLLVEDNSINQMVAGEMLHSFGLSYDIAEDGEQAILKVKNSPYYDLILMDIQMPNLDGYGATTAIRKLNLADIANVPILGLSANAMKEDYEKAKKCGMDEYLTKPIRHDLLRKTIARYLPKSD